jgi:hypothetical protein
MANNKLSFTSKTAWTTQKNKLQLTGEDGSKYYPKGIAVIEIGKIPIAATYDDEGLELTEATTHKDYAVDIDCEVLPNNLEKYLIPAKKKYYHQIAGRTDIKTL